MRKLFSQQLIEARHEMLSIYEALDLTLHDAITAFVTDDKKLANRAQKSTLTIDARCANLEAVCYNLIATQSPVASDFRLLQTIIFIDFNLQRMNDKVRRVARAAKLKVKQNIELPKDMVKMIKQEAELTYRVLGSSISALVSNDLSLMLTLSDDEHPVHEVYERFFREYNRGTNVEVGKNDDAAYNDLRRVIMVSRNLDRIASISMDCAYRLVFLLTGQRCSSSDAAELDLEELESMRVPSGEGTILVPASDARYVAGISLDEVSPELADLIQNGGDEAEAEE